MQETSDLRAQFSTNLPRLALIRSSVKAPACTILVHVCGSATVLALRRFITRGLGVCGKPQ